MTPAWNVFGRCEWMIAPTLANVGRGRSSNLIVAFSISFQYNLGMNFTAIMFSGLPRLKPKSIEFWKAFIEKHNPHVFVHTWAGNEIGEISKVRDIVNIFKPQKIAVDHPMTFDTTSYDDHQAYDINISNVLSMWTSVNKCFNALEQFYFDWSNKPTTLVRTRFDVWVPDGFELELAPSLVMPMEPNKTPDYYHYKEQYIVSQQEILCYGRYEQLKSYCGCINHIPHIMSHDKKFPFISEYIAAAHMHDHKLAYWNQTVKFELER